MKTLWWIAMLLIVIGAINWGLVGVVRFNLVETVLGEGTLLSRVVYILVGLSGLWGIKLLAGKKRNESHREDRPMSAPQTM